MSPLHYTIQTMYVSYTSDAAKSLTKSCLCVGHASEGLLCNAVMRQKPADGG